MRLFAFEKYEGAGNDFIILDFMQGEFLDLTDQLFIEKLCNRHFGIGADGVIALCPEDSYDFRMKYLNSDGRFSTFCGNGSRCISLYAYYKWKKKTFDFVAADGHHHSEILDGNRIKVKMKDIEGLEKSSHESLIQSGSPHLIIEVDDAFNYHVVEEGRRIRNDFSIEGANVNFIEIINPLQLKIATYERGVEDETL
ncbi:MAG: diaminopimelate epimerase, partial [Saprospiraceae bacterium]